MIPYVRGEKPIIFTAERESDIRGVVKFVEETKIKGIIVGGQEAWKVADGLKKNNIAVIYTNIYNLPVRDDDSYDYLYEAPSKMQKAGIRFCRLDRQQRRGSPRSAVSRRNRGRVRFRKRRSIKIRHALSGANSRHRRPTTARSKLAKWQTSSSPTAIF